MPGPFAPTLPIAPTRPEAPETGIRLRIEWLPPHKVVVHNNEHNSFDEVIVVLMRAVPNCTLIEARNLTYEIHLTGAAVVFCGDFDVAEECAQTIRRIGIQVTVEPDA